MDSISRWNIAQFSDAPIRKPASLSPEVRDFLQEQSATLVMQNINLTYDYWTAGMSCAILHVDSI